MSDPLPNPCPWCGLLPTAKEGETMAGPPEHYLECSNQIDCEGWPYTMPHPNPALAITEWNSISKPLS